MNGFILIYQVSYSYKILKTDRSSKSEYISIRKTTVILLGDILQQ